MSSDDIGQFLRLFMIISGVALFISVIISLAKRKMHETFCMAWGILALGVTVAGFVLRPTEVGNLISFKGLVMLIAAFFVVAYLFNFVSVKISELMRKNQELAIQVSLLNQENERILKRLSEITGVEKRDL